MGRMNRVGHCTVCDTPIATITRVYRNTGHDDVDGSPQALGEWDDSAWHLTLLLVEGGQMHIDVCGSCVDMPPDQLMAAWKRICYAQGRTLDPAWLKAKGGMPLDEDQRHFMRKTLAWFAQNPPLGIFSMQRWGELKNERARNADSAAL